MIRGKKSRSVFRERNQGSATLRLVRGGRAVSTLVDEFLHLE